MGNDVEGIFMVYKKTCKFKYNLLLGAFFFMMPIHYAMAAESDQASSTDETVFTLDDVVVIGKSIDEKKPADLYAGEQISRKNHLGVLGERDMMDVPFNVISYTSKMIENKQAATLSDIIVNDPSVSDQSLSGASSAWNIRGFKTTQQDVLFNGLYGVAPRFYTGIEGIDQIEILKGPSALLNGMAPNGTIGGAINFIPKRAEDTPIAQMTFSYGNGKQFTQHLDIGQRSDDGKYGVRVNILNRNGNTSVDDEGDKTGSVTVGLDYKGNRTRTSLDLGYVHERIDNPQYRVTFSDSYLAANSGMLNVNSDAKFGSIGTFRDITEEYGVLHSEYDFNKDLTGYFSFGMRSTTMDYLYNEFQLQRTDGYSRVRYRYNNQINKAMSSELGLRDSMMTGNIKHEITLSANQMNYTRYMYNRILNSYFTNIYSPTWGTPTGDLTWHEPKSDETTLSGIALTDIMSTPDNKWQFIVGGRYQNINVNNYDTSTGNIESSYDKSAFSPAFGLIHKVNNKVSLYGNFIQGLQQGDIVDDSTAPNDGQMFAPYKTTQSEIGAKFDTGKFSTTISAFTIKNPSSIQNPTTLIYSVDGMARHRGFETNIFGEPVKGTRILGGFTYLDAKYRNTAGKIYDGNFVEGVSRFTGVLGVEKDIPSVEGLTLTTRAIYNSSAYINAANTFKVSPWVRWDIGARYAFKSGNTPMTLRADVYNVFNKNYWHALQNAVYLGASRTVMLSLSIEL